MTIDIYNRDDECIPVQKLPRFCVVCQGKSEMVAQITWLDASEALARFVHSSKDSCCWAGICNRCKALPNYEQLIEN